MFLPKNLNKLAAKQIAHYGAQMNAFGIFGCAAFSIPFFMIDSLHDNNQMLILRTLISISCFLLIIRDYWPKYFNNYIPLYWYILLLISLPLYSSTQILLNEFSYPWLINMCICIFLLAVLVDWLSFTILLILGAFSGYVIYYISQGSIFNFSSQIESENRFWTFYVFTISILIGLIFSRNKEFIHLKILEAKENINKQLEDKVKERTTHLEHALSVKKHFLNNMSHEIRIPVQGILGISEGLETSWHEYTDEQKREYNKKILQSRDRLMRLVSNLLDLSKIDSGKMNYNMQKNDLEDLVAKLVSKYISKKVTFKSKLKKSEKLYFDYIRITQTLENLISNAIKFGNDKEITIIIDKTRFSYKDESKEGISVIVTDKGIGIPRLELSRIFAPFEESSNTKTMAGGTGLGLSIAKEIIKAHNGIIFARSNKQGSSFTFILPLTYQDLQASDRVNK